MHLHVILCGLFHLSALTHSAAVKQDAGVVSATVGENVTLHCFHSGQLAMHFSWYRQTLGGGPKLLSSIYKHADQANGFSQLKGNPRFSVQKEEGVNHLHISDVHISDSATYFCGSSQSNILEFGEGVFLSVKGEDFKTIVQGPVSEIIKPGGSVTFNCTVHTASCDEEDSVYWFKHETRQGILHAHGDWRTHVSGPRSPSQSCVYHLEKVNLTSSDAGTYYCAVASCGEIVFGKGSKLLIKGKDQASQMRILVFLSIVRMGILVFFVSICLLVYTSKRRRTP